jgi:hypothetical protein
MENAHFSGDKLNSAESIFFLSVDFRAPSIPRLSAEWVGSE